MIYHRAAPQQIQNRHIIQIFFQVFVTLISDNHWVQIWYLCLLMDKCTERFAGCLRWQHHPWKPPILCTNMENPYGSIDSITSTHNNTNNAVNTFYMAPLQGQKWEKTCPLKAMKPCNNRDKWSRHGRKKKYKRHLCLVTIILICLKIGQHWREQESGEGRNPEQREMESDLRQQWQMVLHQKQGSVWCFPLMAWLLN